MFDNNTEINKEIMENEAVVTETENVVEETDNNLKTELGKKIDALKNTEAGKMLLGEDGKFDKEDVQRLVQSAKDSKLGKTVLGDDGKFDKEDVDRLTQGAKETLKEIVEKGKELLK